VLTQGFVAESQLIHPGRTSGFEHDIGFVCELQKNRAAISGFDIERDTALVGVEMKKVKTFFRVGRVVFERRNAPGFISRRRFDLNDVGAHVG
jgi:hypothetical protein